MGTVEMDSQEQVEKKLQKRRERSEDELQSAVQLITYELQMLEWGVNGVIPICAPESQRATLTRIVENMKCESYVLHARLLSDFLFPGVLLKEDDVIADDYFAKLSKWRSKIGLIPDCLQRNKARMNKSLAHLTYERLEYKKKGEKWDPKQLHRDIFGKWGKFIELLQAEHPDRAEWFLNDTTYQEVFPVS